MTSKARRMAQPRDLMGWFLAEFRAEMPEEMHTGGVWRDRKRRGDRPEYAPVGGSVLGAPRAYQPFEAFIEDSPYACEFAEYEGHVDTVAHYVYPLRAAMASLAGRGKPTDDHPFLVRTLYRTALMDGDWSEACRSMGIIAPAARVYINVALYQLWRRYAVEPPARSLREGVA
jgi:hypothetical protein